MQDISRRRRRSAAQRSQRRNAAEVKDRSRARRSARGLRLPLSTIEHHVHRWAHRHGWAVGRLRQNGGSHQHGEQKNHARSLIRLGERALTSGGTPRACGKLRGRGAVMRRRFAEVELFRSSGTRSSRAKPLARAAISASP